MEDNLRNIFIKIGLVSPDTIRGWSQGRIRKPETINYRSLRPERDGLFCERIFGPTRDYECFCGKYKSMRYRGVVCDRCGVLVTKSEIRRERMGHIELCAPVAHIWFVKRIPSPMALLLGITNQELEEIIYFDSWIVLSKEKNIPVNVFQVLSDSEYRSLKEQYPDGFRAEMGANAIKEALASLDLKKLALELRVELASEKSQPKKKKIIKKLDIVESFIKSKNRPEWMILDAIPVIPPELRPMIQLDGGRFATSDLNDLYRRVINRNNRLERLIDLRAPGVIIRNEKRMLQEAVDALFDNGRRGKPVTTSGNRPLKSLSEILKGKQGRFRQNLLGKRVDYSGRSVIVVDPKLKLNQCGLPKKMAIELFKPFIMRKLVVDSFVHNVKGAKRLIERESTEIWDALEEITKNHIVFLNRAPTLHRASIQAFEPVLVEGDAIKIHPMVCLAFNADFDGDQMAVHIPLSLEAQLEARILMLSAYNLLSPANGNPLIIPTQDIVLGLYYLTKVKRNAKGEGKIFKDMDEAISLYEMGEVDLHALIKLKRDGKFLETTPGRLIFNKVLPEGHEYINNENIDKGFLANLVSKIYFKYGINETARFLDKIKDLGYKFATLAGISISMADIKIPERKRRLLQGAFKRVEKIESAYTKGLITEEEKYNQIIDLWTGVGEDLAKILFDEISRDRGGFNPIYMMLASGARGSKLQIRQLAGMRGLMAKPSGEIIELPITSNFREGLSTFEYFISTHGARKGLADTALKTADAGYLTRRLVNIAQNLVISEADCGTINGIVVEVIKEGDETIISLKDRVLGRVVLEDVIDPMTGELIVSVNCEINRETAEKIDKTEIERIKIRSPLTCESQQGICSKCYGWDLSRGQPVGAGETIGIIAAQSIGEPGTQLTMRTFHIGGTASLRVEEADIKFDYPVHIVELPKRLIETKNGYISLREGNIVITKTLFSYNLSDDVKPLVHEGFWVNVGENIVQTKKGFIATPVRGTVKFYKDTAQIVSDERRIYVKTGTRIFVKEGTFVEPGIVIAEFDPYNEPILTEVSGETSFIDVVPERTLREELDENTGYYRRTIITDREGHLQPKIAILQDSGQTTLYHLPTGTRLAIEERSYVNAGDVIAKFPQELVQTKDITGGLPRVAELFEARRPKDAAVLSEIEGIVSFEEVEGGGTRIIQVKNEMTGDLKEYRVSMGRHLKVRPGDRVFAGDQLVEGPIDPHDILTIKGEKELQTYLLNEIQEVYRLQDVNINDKHIEIIIRQMLRKIRVTDPGDTELLPGDIIDRTVFSRINDSARKEGKRPAQAKLILLGITKSSLATDSFISAASFQDTTRVLTDASIEGKIDSLSGLKENVIIGRLIPAGTGHIEHMVEEESVA